MQLWLPFLRRPAAPTASSLTGSKRARLEHRQHVLERRLNHVERILQRRLHAARPPVAPGLAGSADHIRDQLRQIQKRLARA